MWGGLKYCLRAPPVIGPPGVPFTSVAPGPNIGMVVVGGVLNIMAAIKTYALKSAYYGGVTGSFEVVKTPPGLIVAPDPVSGESTLSIFQGNETAADVNLPTDASTAILVETFPEFVTLINKKYMCRLGYRVSMWENGTESNSGAMDGVVDLYLTTDGAGVVTAVVQDVPPVPPAPTMLPGATMTIAASAGGFTISASRSPGLDCDVECNWWCVKFKDIT